MSNDSTHTTVGEENGDMSFAGIKLTVPEAPTPVESRGHASHSSFDVERAINDDTVQEGTIVTDRKRSKHSIGYVLKGAFTEWWANTQRSVENSVDKLEFLKTKEAPQVESAEVRTSIIQEAAKYAQQAPRDDHAVVVEKVRTLSHDAEMVTGKPYILKSPTEKKAAWSETSTIDSAPAVAEKKEPSQPLRSIPTLDLRSHVIAPNVEKRSGASLASYASPTPLHPSPATQSQLKQGVSRVPERPASPSPSKKETEWSHHKEPDERIDLRSAIAHTVTHAEVRVPEAPPTMKTPLASAPAPRAEVRSAEPLVQAHAPAPSPTFESYLQQERPLSTPKAPESHTPSRMLHTAVIIGVIVVGGALGILTAVLVAKKVGMTPPPDASFSITIPAFLSTDVQIPLPLPATHGALLSALETEVGRASIGVSHLYFTAPDSRDPASTEDIMRVFSPRADGSFVRALNENMMFGSVVSSTREPYIILQSSNFDVAFAGMLSWERDMSSDLDPLFGAQVTESLLPGHGSSTNAAFVDALTSNHSIRILYDAEGAERIVYAFINRDLIIITTNTEALAALIARVR